MMIQQRNERMRQKEWVQRRRLFKKIFTNINVGAMLLSTSALTQIASENAIVHAQQSQKSQKKLTPEEFINHIGQSAKEIAAKNDLYASVMIAQAALESGWGNSMLAQAPNYNLFGVKAGKSDKRVRMETLEDDGTGSYYKINDDFRKYDSYSDSLLDYARVLTGEGSAWRREYYKGALRSNTTSYQEATQHLTGRYATDTRYGGKLNQLISYYKLDQFDGIGSVASAPVIKSPILVPTVEAEEAVKRVETISSQKSTKGSYKVQPGDGFYKIAKSLGVSIDALLEANGLTIDSMIHPNQLLRVPGQTQKQSQAQTPSHKLDNESVHTGNQATKENNSVNQVGSSKGIYTIKPGDSLYRIAANHGVKIQDLLAANGISLNTVIHPNQKLNIPSGHKAVNTQQSVEKEPTVVINEKQTVSQSQAPVQSVSSGNYTVKAGDCLWAIANRHGITLDSLLQANNLSVNSLIVPGQKLVVSANEHVSSTSSQDVSKQEVEQEVTQEVEQATIETVVEAEVSQEEVVTSEVTGTDSTLTQTTSGSYTVKANDTLYAIALRHGLNVNDLIEKNGGTTIYIGQVINF